MLYIYNMKKSFPKSIFLFFFVIVNFQLFSQGPSCPNNLVYIHSGNSILAQPVPMGSGPQTTVLTNLPGGGGLAVGPNFAGIGPNPTYWTTSGGTYWYYNGATWTNTGHSTGNGAAVNIGGGGGFLYNLVGGTGQVYVYNGTGNGTLLFTIPNFNGGGPYDIVCDTNGNIYILNGTNPNQGLYIYSPTGVLLCSYSLTGYPSIGAGGGFAIVNNVVYVHYNSAFSAANMVPGSSVLNFTVQPNITSPSDFASCPIPMNVPATISGGTLGCAPSTTTIGITSTVSPLTYTWTGPGITAGVNASVVTVNQPGVYTASVTQTGCPPKSTTLTYTVVGGSNIIPVFAVTNSLSCLNPTAGIAVTPNATTNTIIWTGPGVIAGAGTPTITANVAGIYTVSISNTVNACAGTGTVNLGSTTLVTTPTIAATNSLTCLTPSTQLSVIPASATNIATWSGPGIVSGNGTYSIIANAPGTYSVIISNAVNTCTGGTTFNLTSSIAPLNVTVSPNVTKCANAPAVNLTAGGAASYSWTPALGLSATVGNAVSANPASTTTYVVVGTTGVCSGSAAVTVSVNPIPVLVISATSPSVCALSNNSSPVTTTLSATGASNYTWTSIFNMTGCGTANSPTICCTTPLAPLNNPGPQLITLVGANGSCTASTTSSIMIIPNPIIGITPATPSICLNNSITLTANGAGAYQWSPTTSLSNSTGASVVANPLVTTNYQVIGSALGCNSSTNVNVTVVPNPIVTAAAATPTVCEGGSINLTAGGATSYVWSNANTLSSNTGANVSATPPQGNTTYAVIGTANTCTNSAIVSVSVIANPVLNVIPSNTLFCDGLSANISVNGASSYVWSPSTFLNATTGNFVISQPSVSTTYVVSGFNGVCTGSTSVTLNVIPVPVVEYTLSQQQICQGQTTYINASGAGSFSWTPNIGLSSPVGSNIGASPNVSTTYTVYGANTVGNVSCGDIKIIEVTVIPFPNAIVSNSLAICKGQSAGLTASGGDTYLWTPSNTVSGPTKANVKVTPTVTTIYTVAVSNQSVCEVYRTVTVVVNPLPVVNAGRDSTYNLGEAMFINATGTGTLTWMDGEEIWCRVCPNTPIYPQNSSCYTIESVNDFGCKASDQVCIEVTKDYGLYIPNVFTPNADGNNEVFNVYGWGLVNVNLEIFDRWGTRLFVSNDQTVGWDGTYKGVIVKSDVYVYKAVVKLLSGKVVTKTGHVSVVK